MYIVFICTLYHALLDHDSEQKLIRQKMDVVPISATVEMEDGLRVPVKLLDCDTISQAKEKLLDCMHKAAPVSKRPKLTEVDLGKLCCIML